MSMGMNFCMFGGQLGRDPECSQYKKGNGEMSSVARFSVGVKRSKEITDWVNLTAFGASADFIQKYFRKGSGILLTAECHLENYTDKEGNKRYSTEFVVTDVKFPPAAGNKGGNAEAEGFMPISEAAGELPWMG